MWFYFVQIRLLEQTSNYKQSVSHIRLTSRLYACEQNLRETIVHLIFLCVFVSVSNKFTCIRIRNAFGSQVEIYISQVYNRS